MNKKYMTKMITAGMITAILITNTGVNVRAAETSDKEEVIYALTNGEGNVEQIYAVNILDGKKVTDYGTYSDVKLLTEEATLEKFSDHVLLQGSENRNFYQGTMETKQLPWKIQIHYSLDGVEYEPEDLASKSGKLEITFDITENKECDTTFYKNYSLQISVPLDGKKCSNIVASDATILNVGSKKQLTYTKLPGKDLKTKITCDVTDFEMDPITMNGMKLNLSIEVDDKKLTKNVNKLSDAISTINTNVGKLSKATNKLVSGAEQLENGASNISNGLSKLTKNNSKLNDAATQMLNATIANVNGQINQLLGKEIVLTASNYKTEMKKLIQSVEKLALPNQEEIVGKINQAMEIIGGAQTFANSLKQYTNSVEAVYEGSKQLKNGINTLEDGAMILNNGCKKLKEGTSKLNHKTQKLPNELSNNIDNMVSSIQTKDTKNISFISDKNENVKAVQFVIKTQKIKAIKEEKIAENVSKKTGFFDKLIALF